MPSSFPSSSSNSFPYPLLLYTSQFLVSTFVCRCALHITFVCVCFLCFNYLIGWVGSVRRALCSGDSCSHLKWRLQSKPEKEKEYIRKHHTVHTEILYYTKTVPKQDICCKRRETMNTLTCEQINFVLLFCFHKTKNNEK